MRKQAFLGLAVALTAAVSLYSAKPATKPATDNQALFGKKLANDKKINHALDRLTFGARPGDAAKVKALGVKKWVELQLNPERIPENPTLETHLAPLATLKMTSAEMASTFPRGAAKPKAEAKPLAEILNAEQIRIIRKGTPEERMALLRSMEGEKLTNLVAALPANVRQQMVERVPADLRRKLMMAAAPQAVMQNDLFENKVYRAIYSTRQLEQVLTDFWYNHFNVYLDKGADRYLVTAYERDAIRPHVLGKFKDILLATAQSPAMLFYLDNWQSSAPPTAQTARGRVRRLGRGLNENYGRELLELHTLGVDGGYTQKDVTETARCFTGWTIKNPNAGGGFDYNDAMHDKGEKTVLGVKIPAGSGKEDGMKVLEILLHHPSTAMFISTKLAQRFVADNPPPALIERMAKTFKDGDGDIRSVLRVMFNSKEFWSHGAYQAKMKSPFEVAISAVRALDAEVNYGFGLAQVIAQLGQPLYRKQEPTGYSNLNEEWVNTAGLVGRMNFGAALAQNKVPGVKVDQTRAGVKDVALLIGSPEFQRR